MGKGLGNRFLDDLRHADALVHVVDVSGTTDAEGIDHNFLSVTYTKPWRFQRDVRDQD
jgi:ribosome-binding ATPase YchF (GTP1/OBG family)